MQTLSLSTADRLARELKSLINSGALKDGDRLVERELASQFAVSRIPLREAIRQLERDGLVEVYRNRGAVVKTLSASDVDDIYQIRALLEGEAIFDSMQRMDADTLARADLVHTLLGSASGSAQQGGYNREFHQLLYRNCKNHRLLEMIDTLRDQIERYELLQNQLLSATPQFQQEHERILHACQQGDAALARDYTVKHILSAGQVLKAHLLRR